MNKFKEIKNMLTCIEVVQRYLGLPVKHNSTGSWYISPFRKEKTASFCVSSKGIHDFGDSMHYDIISFVGKYFNCSTYQALEILCNDFGIAMTNEYETKETIKMLKQKRAEERRIKEAIDTWFRRELINVCSELKINEKCIKIAEKHCNFEALKILYNEQNKLEYKFEILFKSDERTKEKLYLDSI